MTTDQVQRSPTWTRRRALDQSVPKAASDLDVAVWKKTEEEIAEKWIRGPIDEEALKDEFGPMTVVARRFGIEQKGEARVIDDLAEPVH